MRRIGERGFTLIEVLTVVIIIAILVAIALPSYVGMKEREHDREAGASMKLIMAAQKIYRMETATYWEGANEANLNTNLKLSLPENNKIWDYLADSTNPVSDSCVQATRTAIGLPGGDSRIGRTWRMRNTESEPVEGGTCP